MTHLDLPLPRASVGTSRHLYTRGVALPISMILLVVITVTALVAARRSVAHDAVGHNLRTREVATQQAESALRRCESIAIDAKDNAGAKYPDETARIPAQELTGADDANARWRTKANWLDNSTVRINVALPLDPNARVEMRRAPPPQCVIEKLTQGRYLVTARGLSADASFDDAGQLRSGSEIWLQSILSPSLPVVSSTGGSQ